MRFVSRGLLQCLKFKGQRKGKRENLRRDACVLRHLKEREVGYVRKDSSSYLKSMCVDYGA